MLRYLFSRHHIPPGVFYAMSPGEQLVVEAMALLEIDEDGLIASLEAEGGY